MTDLPPCKLCGRAPTLTKRSGICCGMDHETGAIIHPFVALEHDAWTALMSTDADRLEAGRKVMEAAVNTVLRQKWSIEGNDKERWENAMLNEVSHAIRDLDLPTILGIKRDTE